MMPDRDNIVRTYIEDLSKLKSGGVLGSSGSKNDALAYADDTVDNSEHVEVENIPPMESYLQPQITPSRFDLPPTAVSHTPNPRLDHIRLMLATMNTDDKP